MSSQLPNGHIATNPGEIVAHGPHADMLAPLSDPFGSHQVRYDPHGYPIDGQLNLRGGGHIPLDATGMPMRGHNY